MTTVHEAAIANGWNPADGSPWVGPDGVTYPTKQAFYEAQTRVGVSSPPILHRDNCLCPKAARDLPAEMWDERSVASTPLLSGSVLDLLLAHGDRNPK